MSNIRYTVYSRTLTLCMSGESVDEKGHFCEPDQYGTFDTVDAAIAEAREIAAAPDAVKLIDQRGRGIGAIDHLLVYVDAFLHDEETGDFIPCDAEGRTDDPYGPDSIYCHDTLDDHPQLKAAWDKAVRAKWDYLDYESDEYYTVRAFLDEDRGDAVDGGKDDAK